MTADSRKWFALAIICVAQFMVILDVSIVNVALPSIQRGLHFSEQNLLWVLNAYALMFGGFLMLGGRVADKLGRRRVFITGVDHLHDGLPVLWIGDIDRLVGCGPGRAGTGGCDPVSRRPVDPDGDLRGGSGAEHRPEHLGGDRRRRRRVRSPAGRHSHPGVRLAMDLLRQRPDRLGRRTGELLHPHATPSLRTRTGDSTSRAPSH